MARQLDMKKNTVFRARAMVMSMHLLSGSGLNKSLKIALKSLKLTSEKKPVAFKRICLNSINSKKFFLNASLFELTSSKSCSSWSTIAFIYIL